MLHSLKTGLIAAGALALGITAAHAVPVVSLHASNSGIGSMTYSVDTVNNIITINETWTGLGSGNLLFSGLDDVYTVRKNITNNTGFDFTRLASELLDPAGDGDDGADPTPYPAHVPAGFTTSNDFDGLSFINPRSSDIWSDTLIDELTNARDFTDFFNGTLVNGGTGYIEMDIAGLYNDADFIWQQRANASSVIEPASLGLFGLGLAGLGFAARRRRGH